MCLTTESSLNCIIIPYTHIKLQYIDFDVAFYPVDIKKRIKWVPQKGWHTKIISWNQLHFIMNHFQPINFKIAVQFMLWKCYLYVLIWWCVKLSTGFTIEKNVFIFFVLFFTTFNRLYCFIWLNKSMLNVIHQFEIFELMTKRVRVALR